MTSYTTINGLAQKVKSEITTEAARGPSDSQTPYLVATHTPKSDQVGTKANGTPWLFGGIPDGIGAFDNGNGTLTVVVNHELGNTVGITRDYGGIGSYISKLVIDKATLQVTSASDLIKHEFVYNATSGTFSESATAFNRFCSADLPEVSALFNASTGLGYNGGRIFLNGEESGTEGRAFAHFVSGALAGNSYELAGLGKLAHENVVAKADSGNKTVVATTDDGQNGQVYFYVGNKQATGTELQKAGLVGGSLFGVKVGEMVDETTAAKPLGGDDISSFTMVNLGDVSAKSGTELDAASETAGVTSFLRPEDGAWDTVNPNRFYFVTTSSISTPSRLWALDFNDANNPESGGTIRMLLDGTEGELMMDNITVNQQGHVIIQEDVGNDPHLGAIWDYNPTTDALTMIAQHDPARFTPGAANFITQDEESSGVIDISKLVSAYNQNVYLLDVQSHKVVGGELVEGGQLLVMQQTWA
jgi:hypothetical protein